MLTIHFIDGNLVKQATELKYHAIAHGCNCFGKMGKGVAYNIRRMVPEVYAADLRTPIGDKTKLGYYSYVKSCFGFYVFNLYTQYGYSNYRKVINYPAVYSSIRRMCDRMLALEEESPIRIGMPYIGANNAGGSRKELIDTLNKLKEDYKPEREIELFVVNYTPK